MLSLICLNVPSFVHFENPLHILLSPVEAFAITDEIKSLLLEIAEAKDVINVIGELKANGKIDKFFTDESSS